MNLLDFIFPKYCLGCGKNGKYICQECLGKVREGVGDRNNLAIFKYEGVIRKAIIALKYKFAYDLAYELSDICVSKLTSSFYFLNSIVLVPIPLHKLRENWRGFNQSEILGKKIADKMGWKFIPDLLIRNKNTKPQVGLKGLSRRQNLSNVFCINPSYTLLPIRYSLILFDDVYTTGSTIKEAKKVLEMAGLKKVKSLTIAR